MDILEKDEFLKAYRNISAQLKKKFVRKPNVTDAVDGFGKNILFWYMTWFSRFILLQIVLVDSNLILDL